MMFSREIVAVNLTQENRFPAIPAAQGVAGGPFVFDAALLWHEPILLDPGRQVKRNSGQLRAKP